MPPPTLSVLATPRILPTPCLSSLLEAVEGVAAVEAFCAAQHGFPALRGALSAAAWDLAGKQAGEPVWALLGGLTSATVQTSLTIPIGDPKTMLAQAHAAAGFHNPQGQAPASTAISTSPVRLARELPDSALSLALRQRGLGPASGPPKALQVLAGLNAELVEQPLPAADLEGQAWLLDRSPGAALRRRGAPRPGTSRRCRRPLRRLRRQALQGRRDRLRGCPR